jgi:hypothetical protein
LKKNYFSSHKLPKQQSTNFWSQGILGVNTTVSTSNGIIIKMIEFFIGRSICGLEICKRNTLVHGLVERAPEICF